MLHQRDRCAGAYPDRDVSPHGIVERFSADVPHLHDHGLFGLDDFDVPVSSICVHVVLEDGNTELACIDPLLVIRFDDLEGRSVEATECLCWMDATLRPWNVPAFESGVDQGTECQRRREASSLPSFDPFPPPELSAVLVVLSFAGPEERKAPIRCTLHSNDHLSHK